MGNSVVDRFPTPQWDLRAQSELACSRTVTDEIASRWYFAISRLAVVGPDMRPPRLGQDWRGERAKNVSGNRDEMSSVRIDISLHRPMPPM
ncbi:hypothetical protein O1611_g1799 [Lasiodiplodia mahajangana]|uniref:Uncharacterized protein n=1 Tax=Lasiodiplodia mahajangana TaxID=1108764 RepID=A0ACC2JWC3_9PEZI|nr:hypothetical protein O1611_g1799 [Lasiodiplodia mahajangana]